MKKTIKIGRKSNTKTLRTTQWLPLVMDGTVVQGPSQKIWFMKAFFSI